MRDMECTRFDIEKMRIRPGEIPNFGSGRLRYRLLEAPTLRDDEGYYESLSIIIRNSDRVPLAVRKVRYVRSLNLPIWETGIKFKQDGEPDPIQSIFAHCPEGHSVTCPIGGKR